MINLQPYRWHRPAALLAIALLAALPTVQARDAEPQTVNATLTFGDNSTDSITLDDHLFHIDTIAGRISVHPREISAPTVFVPGSKVFMALRNGERWAVDADALITALFGKESVRSFRTRNQTLRSITITAPTPYDASVRHSYKILFKDGSTAIIDPSTVYLPVQMESGRADIPLGSVNAIKFAIPEGQEIPDSIFARLNSGHVYKLGWAGKKRDFPCENVAGNKLTVAYTNILGLLPAAGDISRGTGNRPHPAIRLHYADQSVTTVTAPLQVWSFKTAFGRVSLPSTFVTSFTIPQQWRGQGRIHTIYGESFEGKPDFRSLIHDQDGQARTIALKSLLQVNLTPDQEQHPLPSAAAVFYLVDGGRLAGIPFPCTGETLIKDQEGTAILPDVDSSITRTKGNLFVYAPSRGGPIISTPTSRRVSFALISNGQKVELAWELIRKIEFNRPLRTSETEHERGMTALPLEAALPTKALDIPAETARSPLDTNNGYVQQTGNAVRVRLMRGDIITGVFADDSILFVSTDRKDTRDRVDVGTLRRIIRTGQGTLQYETERGNLIGKATRDRMVFKPAASQSEIRIAIRDIEAVIVGNGPLPPPVTHSAGLPPELCGLVYLPGGSFLQGGGETGMTDETPKITVTLSPFLLDATEVTLAQFAAFVRDSGYKTTAEKTGATTTWMNPGFLQQPDDPVVCVSWTDAAEFCNWRSRLSSLQPVYKINRDGSITTDRAANGYRLPTESEWEYAAGGIRKTAYPWGNTFSTTTSTPLANFMQRDGEKDDGWRWTNPVNAFPPDPNGIYGMAGNVWEWCEDWYFNRAYDALRNRSPLNPCIQQSDAPGLTNRVMRGGSYRNLPDLLRTASRGSGLPLAYAPHVGFRCARNAN